MPSWRPSSPQGSDTSGRPSWVARISSRSWSVSRACSDFKVEVDMKLLLLGHVVYRVAGQRFNVPDGFGNAFRGFCGQDKPHVQFRSEERRVGKECRYRWSWDH